ncbi:hypothetical protein Taro_040178 [Colocasia esculenta]|uniref:Uncharacterized protein n=1 Tax=Colocasia esculenta TaxID=4460 RepID=A0A843WCI0_COLES|nr:hypothetical protein [Colocasia esculenta]
MTICAGRSRRNGEEDELLVVVPQLLSRQELFHTTPASSKLVPRASTIWTPTLIPASSDVDANFSDLHALQSQKFRKQATPPIGELSPTPWLREVGVAERRPVRTSRDVTSGWSNKPRHRKVLYFPHRHLWIMEYS